MPIADLGASPDVASLAAGGYAVLLLLVALGIERMARQSRRRSEAYHSGGFAHRPHEDALECPAGQTLWPVDVDHRRGLTRYRAQAAVCNRCPLKAACTDSTLGREVTVADDGWAASELARFHRGISLLLVGLAGLVVALALVRQHGSGEVLVLGPILALALLSATRRARVLLDPG